MAGRYLVPAKAGAQHKARRKAGFLFWRPSPFLLLRSQAMAHPRRRHPCGHKQLVEGLSAVGCPLSSRYRADGCPLSDMTSWQGKRVETTMRRAIKKPA